jgi:hypothetical protein
MSETNDKKNYVRIEFAYLEPYLKLPSGLPLTQIKKQAKKIKKAQEISQAEALKIMLWGNGLPSVRDYEQALPILVEETFGITHNQMAFVQEEADIVGISFKDPSDEEGRNLNISTSTISLNNSADDIEKDKQSFVKRMTEYLKSVADGNIANEKFVETIRSILRKVGDDFVYYRKGQTIDTFKSKHDIDFDLEKMLSGGGSGGILGLKYALASTYNNSATENEINQKNLLGHFQELKESGLAMPENEEDLIHLFGDVRARCYNFGYLCYNLDEEATQLVKDLITYYRGW